MGIYTNLRIIIQPLIIKGIILLHSLSSISHFISPLLTLKPTTELWMRIIPVDYLIKR